MPSPLSSSVSPLVQWTNDVCLSNIRRSNGDDTFENTFPELFDIVFKQLAKCYTSGKSMLALVSERKQLAIANLFWEVSWVLVCHSGGEAGKNGDNEWNKARKWCGWWGVGVSYDSWWGRGAVMSGSPCYGWESWLNEVRKNWERVGSKSWPRLRQFKGQQDGSRCQNDPMPGEVW